MHSKRIKKHKKAPTNAEAPLKKLFDFIG